MKIINFLFAFLASISLAAQNNSLSKVIEPYRLQVTYNKTSNLIFPSGIKSVDRGSQDILAEKAAGVENILRVKADVKDFPETNLTVITADGKLYSFIVEYCKEPLHLNFYAERIAERDRAPAASEQPAIFSEPVLNSAELAMYADSVLLYGSNTRPIHTRNSKVSAALNGIYIHEDVIFLKFDLRNNSNMNFDIDQFHIYIRDKVQVKRTASQELELIPLTVTGETQVIRTGAEESSVVAFQKFTIPADKYLSVQILEKNGARNLFLKVKGKKIMKAQII